MEQDTYQDQASIAAPAAEVAGQSRVGRQIAATRKSRTRNWPEESTHYERFSSLEDYKATIGDSVYTIGKGMSSGRNLLAYFDDQGDTPLLKFNIRCEQGRSKKLWPNYPHPSDALIPVGTTLAQVCSRYPLHCWADGLRIFMAENWSAEQIWHCLPHDARNEGASVRKWNYLQQAMGREADKMYEEDENTPRVVIKRKKEEPESEVYDEEEDSEEVDEEGDEEDAVEDELQAASSMTFEPSGTTVGASNFLSPSTYTSATFAPNTLPDLQQETNFLMSAEYVPHMTFTDMAAGDSDLDLNLNPGYDSYLPSTTFSQSPQLGSGQDFADSGLGIGDFTGPLNLDYQDPQLGIAQDFSTLSPQSSLFQYSYQCDSSLSPDMDATQNQYNPYSQSQSSPIQTSYAPQVYQQPFQDYQSPYFRLKAKNDLAALQWPPQNAGYVPQYPPYPPNQPNNFQATMSPLMTVPAYSHAPPTMAATQQPMQPQYLTTQQHTGWPVMWDASGVVTNNISSSDIVPSIEADNLFPPQNFADGSRRFSQQSIGEDGSSKGSPKKRKAPNHATEASEEGHKRSKTTPTSARGGAMPKQK